MKIRMIDTENRQDVRRFIEFPFELYRDSLEWVPPLTGDMRLILNKKKHPYFEHSAAEFLLAEEGGKTLGRVAVLDNRVYNEYQKKRTAFFYLFDAIEDKEVSRALFEKAVEWAGQRGLSRMTGPSGFIQGDGIGLLVHGFEHRPAMGIPYNYSYYDDLMKDAGFAKLTDTHSGYLSGAHVLDSRFYDIAESVKAKRNFHIKSFKSKRELKDWVPEILKVVNSAFSEGPDYFPMNEREAKAAADRLMMIADPRLIKLVMKGEEIIGFLFVFVDISEALKKTKGRLWPFGWYTLAREFRKSRWANFNGTGLIPGHRGVGANAVLYTEMAKTFRDFRFEHADIVQIDEANFKSMGDMKAIGVDWYKTHRVYEKIF